MLFISERAGWITISMILLVFGSLGILVTQGYLHYDFDYIAHINRPQTWLNMAFSLTAFSTITGYAAMQFLRFLQNLLAASRAQAEALRETKEKVEAANRAKQEFLAGMSHELNTPLHSMLGYLDMLGDSGLSLSQRGHIAVIRQSGEHLHALVNAILDTARLERQQWVLNPVPCALPELLNHIADMMRIKAQGKGLQFEVFLPAYLPAEIIADNLRLRQILLNLLTNAVKYTKQGYVHLNLKIIEQQVHETVLHFEVVDSGSGIAPEEQTRLLLPFERGRNSAGESGAGLGLSLVRQLLQQMDSELKINSSSSGSRVGFQLKLPVLRWVNLQTVQLKQVPIAPPPEILQVYWCDNLLGRLPILKQSFETLAQETQYQLFAEQALNCADDKVRLQTLLQQFFPVNQELPNLATLALNTDLTRLKLLIIDDDSFNVHLMAHYLRDFNFDILSAPNGLEGFTLARCFKPQLILLDLYMLGMSGFETCRRLKADLDTQAIPVIFFSASQKSTDIAAAFANDGQDYILKPAREEEVIARITAHLQPQILQKALINRLNAYETRLNREDIPHKSYAKNTVEKLYQVRELLLKDIRHTPALEELAQTVGLNRNKLNDEFRLLFGDTLFAWLREQRLQHARYLLVYQPELPIQVISELTGHTAVAHFSRTFKQRFGLSPREYRHSLITKNRIII
jgi:signal transduction histidine kinase/DNA-binding response OmpR family regulator